MITKTIHYCWFGGKPLTNDALHCIDSWRKFFPDYQIREWNESNFDVNMVSYTREAYRLGMYAFVSDYVRFYVLEKYGGIYFDVDVEVIKPMNTIVERGQFMGFEAGQDNYIAVGLGMGLEKGSVFARDVIFAYNQKHFTTLTGVMTGTVVHFVTDMFKSEMSTILKDGIVLWRGVYVYPSDYFCPINYYSGESNITENTVSIHHYASSWSKEKDKSLFKRILKRLRYLRARFIL